MNDREDDPNAIIPETVEIEFTNRWSAFHYHYNAKSSDTIEMLKFHYQNAFKVSAQHLFFFSKWRKLENHQTLEFYGIRNFAVVHVEVRSHQKLISMPILAFLLVMAYWEERVLCKNKKEQDQIPEIVEIKFKRFFSFSHYYYEAKRSDTVGMLKLHYQKAFRIPEQHLCCYSNWSKLENHQPLSFYGLRGFAEVNVYVPEDTCRVLMLAIIVANFLFVFLLFVAIFKNLRTQ
ncbi:unnamed protein product [Caenorhabditis nigoni]